MKAYSLSAILGGLLWLVLHLALTGAWDRGDAFPTYEFLKGLHPLPLALFAFALYGLHQGVSVRTGRRGRTGLWISLAGFGLLATGAALEFWVGGGVLQQTLQNDSSAGLRQ